MNITDTDGNALTTVGVTVAEGQDSLPPIVVRVPCVAGRVLRASDATTRVMGRTHGVGAYADLATSPISLTPWDGATHDFDLVVRGVTVATEVIDVTVGFP